MLTYLIFITVWIESNVKKRLCLANSSGNFEYFFIEDVYQERFWNIQGAFQ